MPRLKCAALLAAIAALTGMAHGDGAAPIGEPLPEAEAGACFARVRVPAVYREVPVELTTREAYDAVEVRQASFAPDKTEVKVRDEAVRYRVTEPRYETVTEKALVRPAHRRGARTAPGRRAGGGRPDL